MAGLSAPTHPLGIALLVALMACADADKEQARAAACQALEQSWSIESTPAAGSCPAPPQPRDVSSASKVAVAVYHFNVQYVAGGVRGFPDGEIVPRYDLDEIATEDRIVRQGIEPVLDLFLAHPDFHADFELQAYAVEIMAKRHPDVLAKLRTLAERGQLAVDSFHYSDQLYVAYPKRDLVESIDLTAQIFARTCVPLGRSIFSQEGQFAVGQLPVAQAHGYRVSVLAKNLFNYQFGEAAADRSVLYADPEVPGHNVILGGKGWSGQTSAGPFELRWTFMDDGEIAFSKNALNPYFGLDYEVDPEAIANHAQELEAMAAEGYVFATIEEAVLAMNRRQVPRTELPPVLDGTWQPKDTGNVTRWMGGAGLFKAQERDSEVLAAIWRARTAVEDAERRLPNADGLLARGLDAAWREAALAAVSDSTGWNPFINEVRYSLDHAEAARLLSEQVLSCAGVSRTPAPEQDCQPTGEFTPADLGIAVRAPARAIDVRLESCVPAFGARRLFRLSIDVPKTSDSEQTFDENEGQAQERELHLSFARSGDSVSLAQAAEDRVQSHRLDDYVFDDIGVPLPIGLIGLGGDRHLIQDQASARLAATISRSAEGRATVQFIDLTVTRVSAAQRRYYWVEGLSDAAALALAESINRPQPSP